MDRYLAIDYGTKRIGLAITDPLKIIAQPFQTLSNDGTLLPGLKKIIQDQNVSRIILGNPIKLDGSIGQAAQAVLEFKKELEKNLPNIQVLLVDERMTTAEAQKRMLETDASRKKRKENIDQTAAALLLQNYLRSIQ